MKRRLVPVVEIATRPLKSRARQPSPSTAAEPAPSSPRKRRKGDGDDGTMKQVLSGIPISPTVSDYEDATMDCSTNGLLASPTVSDFSAQGTSVTGVTLSPSEEDEEVTPYRTCLPRHRLPDSLPTPLASGSSVTLEAMPTSFEEINDSYDDNYTKSKAISRRKVADKEQEVLRHRNMTVVTPIVSRIARHLFKGSLEVAGTSAFDDADVAAEIDNVQAHHNDPASMKWGSNDLEGQSYASVIMDGVEYCVGDDVMVNPGDDEDTRRAQNAKADASQSPNSYANRLWFCRICYFFETIVDGQFVKMFHGQWFVHGSKTILQETAHSKSLFLLYKCEDNPIASIFKKCKVTMMGSEDLESIDDGQPDANDFHCSLAYNEKDAEFLDIPGEDELAQVLEFSPPSKPCLSCGMQRRQDDLADYMSIFNGFSHFGIDYHLYDFIYIRPKATAGLLDVAQIVKISSSLQVTVQYFGRYNKLNEKEKNFLRSDERHLYLRTKKYILDDLDRIEGVCFIRHLTDSAEIDRWVKHDDHFYVNQQGGDGENGPGLWEMKDNVLHNCGICYKKRVEKLRQEQKLLEINGPITCLELFSGAGGLGTGLDISGFVKTKYAVEFSPSAAATYQVNHPEATVYCQDSSLLLKHAIETDAGNDPKPLKSNNGKTYLPHMPKKTEIDMISGGPPCQSFSRANHNPKANDIRSTLPVNMLSYVEHYDPRYFLLENVAGFINYRLMSTHSKTKRSLQGGIEAGMVKFVMRSLIALGYQVRCKLLQAGQYGAPQGRRRVIFWGAKRGNPIPGFPIPVYAFPRKMNRSTLPTGYLHPVSRSLDPEVNHQCAPLPAITVDDAIGDLPPFEWINPHEIIPMKDFNKRENKRRREDGIQQFRAVQRDREAPFLTGFPKGVEYATAPTNRYQMWLRSEMGDKKVEGQYTRTFSARLVEATTTVPLKPWADHRDLPLVLQPNHAKPGAKQADKSFYGRMDGASQFKCAMTKLAPNVKQSWVLHPSQKRIVSVRECARTQGFPDHYIFMSADDAPQKLVENEMRSQFHWRCTSESRSVQRYRLSTPSSATSTGSYTMPSTAIQSRISAFESIANSSKSSQLRKPQPNGRVFETPLSPPFAARQPTPASPSPSPPNLGRKTSLIDLKDWIVDDGPSSPHTNGFKHYGSGIGNGEDNGRTPTHQGFESKKKLIAPLINLESPPRPKYKVSPTLAAKAPPLPPRKPSYASLKSVASMPSAGSSNGPHRSDSLTVDHTYPPFNLDPLSRSRNSSGHAPASSISSFHSVSLSSDTDPSTPGSASSNFIATFPIDREREQRYGSEADSVSLDESYEEVSTPSISSPATERIITLDWEKAMAKRKPVPPKLPQRPSLTSISSSSSIKAALKSPPPKRQSSSSSTCGSPGFRASVSSVSSSSTVANGAIGRCAPPPPPSRNSDRSSIQSLSSSYSHSSQGHNGYTRPLSNLHLKTKRPTPVPAAARVRYESVFNTNVIQQRNAEKEKAKERPALLSPTEARGTRRAAGWRGLSVDLITGGDDVAATPSTHDDGEVHVVDNLDKLEGYLIKTIWRRSRLDRRRLADIWNECDPSGTGSLTRDAFVKGMWRIDEELRRVQTQALKSTSATSLGSLRGRGALFKPPILKPKPILR
ncbi:hypothetical protein D9615_004125 [Tricholomella constricta]|uniref:Cytosine-specific methyltransferase n=1 Tax=Tricholomella constricta TaxID=117010 RepID=A0A8H5HCN2_9AGAR|nr:hypothetical protein D9615_004125 [Tricholomella constricta]